MPLRLVLVDDHRMMREGLRALLAREPDIEVVGEASDGRTALEVVRQLAPDVVVMDVGLPDLNGIEATRRIKAEHPGVAVIALSMHTDRRYVQRMLAAGAAGYVPKIKAHEELLRAVRGVSAGRRYLSPEIAALAGAGEEGSVDRRLGPREREVLQLVAEGLTSKAIGVRLEISVKTVETHRRNIVRKLALHSTAELTKFALREGLSSLEG